MYLLKPSSWKLGAWSPISGAKSNANAELQFIKRKNNINTEFYPDSVSLKKQLNYANKNMIPYVLFYGEEEKENLYFNLKDMNSGNQQKLSKDQLLKVLVEN